MAGKAITVKAEQTAAVAVHQWTDKEINTIKNTVAREASDEELTMFLHLAATYGLDPFKKELWFYKAKNTPVIFTSRDGYLSIANRDPHFSGMVGDVVYSGDKFAKSGLAEVRHEYGGGNRGQIIGAYAIVYRDDRKVPTYVFVPFSNYRQNNQVWGTYPHAMILKVAEAMALKRAFSISGLVTQEELAEERTGQKCEESEGMNVIEAHFRTDEPQEAEGTQSTAQTPQPEPHNLTLPEYKRKLWNAYLWFYDGDEQLAREAVSLITGGVPSKEWSSVMLQNMQLDIVNKFKARAVAAASFEQPQEQIQEAASA